MRSVPAAVTVVTAVHDGQRNGLTATAVCSVSAEPAQLLVCINQSASAEILIQKSGRFAVSYLCSGHEEVSQLFSRSKLEGGSRFAAGKWKETESGSFVLADAIAYFDCEVVSHQNFGTHSVFVGRVIEANTLNGEPLIYGEGGYKRLG
jgi:flavin reductase